MALRDGSDAAILAGGAVPLVGALAAAYWLVVRPWHLRWGATAAETARRWPGDELMARPRSRAVRAVTIGAPPDRVWPWIRQLGRDRGGFYSYTWLENLVGADIRNVYEVIPGLAERQPGETVWLGPEDRFGGQARMVVAKVDRERALVLVPPGDARGVSTEGRAREGVWSFILDPLGEEGTRLVMLSLGGEAPTALRRAAELLFWEPAHFVMERRMMLTIQRLAEDSPSGSVA